MAAEIVIDNTDPGFSTTGSWSASTWTDGYYGSNYLYASSGLWDLTDTATWRPNIPVAGQYEVWVYFNTTSSRDRSVPYTVEDLNGEVEYELNQRESAGWNLLGVHEFGAGSGGFVRVESSGSDNTVADAAKFVSLTTQEEPPYWVERDFVLADAQPGEAYSASIADKAADPNGDVMTFTITPDDEWLQIDAQGTVSGIPYEEGLYIYTVTVTDGNHPDLEADSTTMTVVVTDDPVSDCLDGITNYTEQGPFSYDTARDGNVKMWVPRLPEGCKVPVIHLANGTGGRCSTYGDILEHLATHGFLTTCYEDTNTGYGTQCIEAVETAMERYPEIADDKLGFTGHSQGGGAAFICTYRAEQQWGDDMTITGHAMEPASGYGDAPYNWEDMYEQITSPMFMFNGSRDSLVSTTWVRLAFEALNDDVEAYWYEAQGASHIPIPEEWTIQSATAWFRWKLLGDTEACEYFKDLPDTRDWDYQDSKNESSCN